MEPGVLFLSTLVADVGGDGRFGVGPTDRIDEIAARPERTAPELLLDLRMALQYFAGRNALDRLNDGFREQHRYRLHEEVDMIVVGTNFKEVEVVAFANFQAGLLDRLIDVG